HPTSTLFPYTTLFRSHLGRVGELAPGEPLADRLEEVRRRVHAHVRGEEDLFELGEHGVVEGFAGPEKRVEPGDESAAGLGKSLGDRKSTRLNSSHRTI